MHASINSSLSLNFKLGLCHEAALLQSLGAHQGEEVGRLVGRFVVRSGGRHG
jgi:hypothetical protein